MKLTLNNKEFIELIDNAVRAKFEDITNAELTYEFMHNDVNLELYYGEIDSFIININKPLC